MVKEAPTQILRQCFQKQVSVELVNGSVVNGLLVHCDATMNMRIKDCIRTHSTGDVFWKGREAFVRAASVKSVQMEERALVPVAPKRSGITGRGRGRGVSTAAASTQARGRGSTSASARGRGRGSGRGRGANVGEKRRRDDTAAS